MTAFYQLIFIQPFLVFDFSIFDFVFQTLTVIFCFIIWIQFFISDYAFVICFVFIGYGPESKFGPFLTLQK